MTKIKVDHIDTELVPWKSKEELSKRISDNFDWHFPGDPIPKKLTYAHTPTGHCSEISPLDEVYAIITRLPKQHQINQELILQASRNLTDITTKSPNELKGHIPRYLNSFWIGDVRSFRELFNPTLDAAYHITNKPVFTDTKPPKEDEIMFSAVKGVLGYSKSHPKKILEFLDNLNDKQLVFPFLFTGYTDLKNEKTISIFFNLYNKTNGQNDFILNGIKREVKFDFIGKRLKRAFPDYDYQTEINKSKLKLKRNLEKIFT